MTINEILTGVASYFGKNVADLTVNSQNLGLLALNQVRTNAELLFDFEFTRQLVTLTVDGVTGGSLDDAIGTGNTRADWIDVTGSGTTSFIGTYVPIGMYNGATFYVKSDDPTHSLYKTGSGEWWLAQGTSMYYYAPANGLTGTWQADMGDMPSPQVSFTEHEVPVEIKTILEIGVFDTEQNLRPVEWTTRAESLERLRTQRVPSATRYPTDQQATALDTLSRIVVGNRDISVVPKAVGAQFELGLEVYVMTPDWTTGDLNLSFSPWTTKGSQYLMWQTVIHLNHLFKEFVMRQEGNVAPPQQLAEMGLEALRTWDVMQFELARRHGR